MNKIYITADQLLEDSFELAMQILESNYRPTFIISVWRGGAPIGIAVQELLEIGGVKVNHITVRTSSYSGINDRSKQVVVHGLGYAVDLLSCNDNVLIVDDVHDSGLSVEALLSQIKQQCVERAPCEIKLATVYYKSGKSKVKRAPDYYLHETNEWLVFPHELAGLSKEELAHVKPGLKKIKERLLEKIKLQ